MNSPWKIKIGSGTSTKMIKFEITTLPIYYREINFVFPVVPIDPMEGVEDI